MNSQILGASIQNSVVQVTWQLGFVHPTSKVCNLNLSMPSCSSQEEFLPLLEAKVTCICMCVCVCVCDRQNCNICSSNDTIICYCKNIVSRAYIPLLKKGEEGK